MGLQNLLSKARQLARGREHKIDSGLDKAERAISERTGGKYDDKLRSAREKVDENLTDRSDGSDQPASERPHSGEPGTESPSRDEPGTEPPSRDDADTEPPRRDDTDKR